MKISENKFLRILDSFRDDELGEFRKFVSSPYIASGRNYLPVLNEILRQGASDRNEISLEDLHKKLYPGKRFSAQTLKNRLSELFRIAEEYLIHKSIENHVVKEKDPVKRPDRTKSSYFRFFDSSYRKALTKLDQVRMMIKSITTILK